MFLRIDKTLASAVFFLTNIICASALADDCENLKTNREWTAGMRQIRADYNNKNYDVVLSRGEELSYHCARSPELNYYIGKSYEAKGLKDDALVYLGIACDSAADFETSPEIVRDIYYSRYELEHPDTSLASVNALKQENARIKHENKLFQEQIEALREYNSTLSNTSVQSESESSSSPVIQETISVSNSLNTLEDAYTGIMWAGIGIGIGGAVITGIGGALVGTSDKYSHTGFHEEELSAADAVEYGKNPGIVRIQDYKIAPSFVAGWTLVGAGIAATVTGIILAGVYGSKKSHVGEDFSLNISPLGFDFGLRF